jgi:hypothetical protein
MTRPDDVTQATWFNQAAAEAREASRRYWAKGGYADQKYPMQPMPWWSETPTGVGDENLADRRRRRQVR